MLMHYAESFMWVFKPWGLKKLIATHYEPNTENFSYAITAKPDTEGNFDWQQSRSLRSYLVMAIFGLPPALNCWRNRILW